MSSSDTSNPEPDRKAEALGPETILLEQMNSEYEILQDKLDKIGGFRTTIRGWSVTLVIASIIAAGSSKEVSPYFLSLLFVFIYAFYAMERKQNQFADIFGARILHLEKRMREELRAHVQATDILGFYPGIAHHLHSSTKRKSSGYVAVWLTDPDRFFYIAQGVSVGIAMAVLVFLGPAPKSPDVQNVIHVETTRPEAQPKQLDAVPSPPATPQMGKKEGQQNVEEKGH